MLFPRPARHFGGCERGPAGRITRRSMAEFTTPDSIGKIDQLVPAYLTSSELRTAPEEHDSKTTAAIPLGPDVSKAHPLRNSDFRFLWIGSTISAFGDQFYFVGLSWLVLLFYCSGPVVGDSPHAGSCASRRVYVGWRGVNRPYLSQADTHCNCGRTYAAGGSDRDLDLLAPAPSLASIWPGFGFWNR